MHTCTRHKEHHVKFSASYYVVNIIIVPIIKIPCGQMIMRLMIGLEWPYGYERLTS